MSISLLIAEALKTRRRSAISLPRQLWQACCLRFGPCKLDPWEYFFFQVYLDRYSPDEKRRFIGWRQEIQIDRLSNAHNARKTVNNKLAFQVLLGRHGVPLPVIKAVYGNSESGLPGKILLSSTERVKDFLLNNDHYPLFVKPISGAQGNNTFAFKGTIDRNLLQKSARKLPLKDFIDRLDSMRETGILFQELLKTHHNIEQLCGNRLTSVRIIIVLTPAGPQIISAVWRVPTGSNITDNFNCGKNGNIIAGIEIETGRVQRMIQGIGWKNTLVNQHPDTGFEFGHLQLPDWEQIRSLCLDNATLFPDLRLQHWDVALTDRGPVVLEMNVEGGMRAHQIVQQRGIYDMRIQQACR